MNETLTCPICKTVYEKTPDTCVNCGYPFSGTDKERSHYVAHNIIKRGKISDTRDSLKWARIILIILGIAQIIVGMFYYGEFSTPLTSVPYIIGVLFIVCAFLTRIIPLIAVAVPLGILLINYLAEFLFDPLLLFSGLLWKILIVFLLTRALWFVIRAINLKKESNFLASKKHV